MENTIENKAKFFALYWGGFDLFNDKRTWHNAPVRGDLLDRVSKQCYLRLKPLSSISDEDATKALNLHRVTAKVFLELYPIGDSIELDAVDYLRSKGYALPFMGISVEQMVEWGWIKL